MTIYLGDRTIDGVVVERDGQPLDPGESFRRYSEIGVDWGCIGQASRQLAFALLYDHLKDVDRAAALVEPFTRHVVAEMDNEWELDTVDLARFVQQLELA